jgi:hypothetical protein
VEFEFIKKLDDMSYAKPWLTVSPSKEVIKPGQIMKMFLFLEFCVDTLIHVLQKKCI